MTRRRRSGLCALNQDLLPRARAVRGQAPPSIPHAIHSASDCGHVESEGNHPTARRGVSSRSDILHLTNSVYRRVTRCPRRHRRVRRWTLVSVRAPQHASSHLRRAGAVPPVAAPPRQCVSRAPRTTIPLWGTHNTRARRSPRYGRRIAAEGHRGARHDSRRTRRVLRAESTHSSACASANGLLFWHNYPCRVSHAPGERIDDACLPYSPVAWGSGRCLACRTLQTRMPSIPWAVMR